MRSRAETRTPASSRASRLVSIAVVVGQLLVLFQLVRSYDLLDRAFRDVFVLVLVGFVVHELLPPARRLAFFALLSIGGTIYVLGPSDGLWLVAVGLALIGLSHLPVRFGLRVVAVLAAAAGLAYLRAETGLYPSVERALEAVVGEGNVAAPWSAAVWPVLGSMFMFRLVLYLYELKHPKTRPSLWGTLGYFFMVPNVCFPLFPVVDYARFRNDYYTEEGFRIYQRGVVWILRGLAHLVLYRFVYYYLVVDPAEVAGAIGLARFAVSSFLLYLQVSGQFHLIVGILLLFGFNLPETHHRYLLAGSFTDHWRRINIYWKDFMLKIFYYPIHMRLRRRNKTAVLAVATIVVFLMTWALHLYQWFWLRGTLLFETHDILFWAILGVLVVVNALWERSHGRERSLGRPRRTPARVAAHACGVGATFWTVVLLWSMWSSDSLEQWLALWRRAMPGAALLALLPPVLLAVRLWLSRRAARAGLEPAAERPAAPTAPTPWWRPALGSVPAMVLLWGLAEAAGSGGLPPTVAHVVMDLRSAARLNDRDLAKLERGYYENLIAVSRHNTELWRTYNKQPDGWANWPAGAKVPTGDLREYVLAPGLDWIYKGARVTTNEWGLRDRSYSREKPPGTTRIALLGASHVFGSGVADEETFEALVEKRWNEALRADGRGRIEILNFAYQDRNPVHQVMMLDEVVLSFEPDVVLYVAHSNDARRTVRGLSAAIKRRVDIPYPWLAELLARSGAAAEMSRERIEASLADVADEIVERAYGEIVRRCRANGIEPLWVFLPLTYERPTEADVAVYAAPARRAGFDVLSLADVYDGYDVDTITVAPWDKHPNALGHRLVAERLYEILAGARLAAKGTAERAVAKVPDARPAGREP